jgi:hypothetical protein
LSERGTLFTDNIEQEVNETLAHVGRTSLTVAHILEVWDGTPEMLQILMRMGTVTSTTESHCAAPSA